MALSKKLCAWSCCVSMLAAPVVCAAGDVGGGLGGGRGPGGVRAAGGIVSSGAGAEQAGSGRGGPPGAQEADGVSSRLVSVAPGSAEAHFRQAEALSEAGRFDAALSTYTLAIALSPDHEGALKGRWRLCARLLLYRQALKDLSRLIELRPGKAEYHYERGRTLLKLHSVREAFRDFQRAHELDRSYPRPTLIEDRGPADRFLVSQGRQTRMPADSVRAYRG